MVEQVLALGSLEARQRAPEVAPVDLAPLVAEAAAAAAKAFDGAHLETDLAPDLPPVPADPPALRRAVENLVTNALKHGGDELRVRVRLHARPPGREVRIEVADRGPGIPPEDREHLFEPFFRGRRARDAQRPGAGLGLHLVRRVAEVHGGRVEVETGAGGSTFTLCLPAGRSPGARGDAA
jgi:two-component system OmpR family sensor kinase